MEDTAYIRPRMVCVGLVLLLSTAQTAIAADADELASRLFQRLTGNPLLLDDPRREEMERLIDERRFEEAARIATEDDGFYNVTLREWAAPLSNRDGDRFFKINDFTAMVIGSVRDGRDFREILTGDYSYVGDSSKLPTIPAGNPATDAHYDFLENNRVDLRNNLVRVEPQRPGYNDAAGVLTSLAWSQAHLAAGTNRRIVQYTFQDFLCRPLPTVADTSLMDFYVRRDVDRSPGGSSKTYEGTCRGCHAALDGLSSAFAYVTHNNNFVFSTTVQGKMNQNNAVYREGKTVADAAWVNLWVKNLELGFRGEQSGSGIRPFGWLIANSVAFSQCMTSKVFEQVCRRSATESENSLIADLANRFEASGYNLRQLFELIAVMPNCLGR